MRISYFFNKKFVFCAVLASFFAVSGAYADDPVEPGQAAQAEEAPTPLADILGDTPRTATRSRSNACGENLFNPNLLSEADFGVEIANGNMTATGKWGPYLNTYIAAYNFYFKPRMKYKVSYTIRCDNGEIGNHYLGLKLARYHT